MTTIAIPGISPADEAELDGCASSIAHAIAPGRPWAVTDAASISAALRAAFALGHRAAQREGTGVADLESMLRELANLRYESVEARFESDGLTVRFYHLDGDPNAVQPWEATTLSQAVRNELALATDARARDANVDLSAIEDGAALLTSKAGR